MNATPAEGFVTKDLLETARRWWLLILVAALLGTVGGAVAADASAQRYQSGGKLLIGSLDGPSDSVRASAALGSTYADVLTSQTVLRDAATKAGIPASVSDKDLRSAVDATNNDKSRVLAVTVTWSNPTQAHDLATRLVDEALALRAWVPTPRAVPGATPDVIAEQNTNQATGRVTVVEPATLPTEPLARPSQLFTILAGVLAGAVSWAVAVFIDSRRSRRRGLLTSSVLQHRLLGTCHLDFRLLGDRQRLVVIRRPSGSRATEYRLIAAKSELLTARRPLSSLAVFGARHMGGSGEVTANLALTYARSGRNVMLVDLTGTDAATRRMRMLRGEHVVERVEDHVLEMVVTPVESGQVSVVVSHDVAMDVGATKSSGLVDLLEDMADMVVLHAPPLLLEPTTVLVAEQVDGVAVVVGEEGGTRLRRPLPTRCRLSTA